MIKLLVLIGFSFFSPAPETDSVGIETVNGKLFIVHKVDEKETLFAISRRYRSTVDEILQHNAGAGSGLEIGQILRIPFTPKEVRPADAIVHKVAARETLFSISKIYGVTLDQIKQWNKLPDNALSVGQELVIRKNAASNKPVVIKTSQPVANPTGMHTVAQGETMYSIARQYGISVEELKAWNKLETNELKIGQTIEVRAPQSISKPAPAVVSAPVPPAQTQPKRETIPVVERNDPVITKPETKETIKISEAVKNGDEVIQAGIAELIEGTEGNRKYLALHRTAPVGTILKVRNEMNNREVFVRVMGKLPDTAVTDKVVIRISKSAYDRLGAIDPRFRVEVTYYK
jgi:LysM repeat protein